MKTCVRLVLTLVLLIGINKTGYTQELYEKVIYTDMISPDYVYIIVSSDCKYAMGKVQSSSYAATESFKPNSNKTLGCINIEPTEEHPYEFKIENHTDGYSLYTKQGYLYYNGSNGFKINSKLNSAKEYYWTYEFTKDFAYPRLKSSKDKEYFIKPVEHSKDGNIIIEFGCYKSSSKNIYLFRKLSTYQSVPITISPVKYATLYYSDKNLIVPDGVEAYTYKYEDGLMISSKYKYMDIIPAGTAVVLHGNAGTYNFIETSLQGITDENNVLEGTDTTTDLENDDNYYFYMLSTNQDNDPASVGFYWGTANGRAFSNGANKAYLKIKKADAADAKSFFQFSDLADETTEINMTHAAPKHHDNSFYTLQGMKINYPTEKGIYILNGKKIVYPVEN